MLALAIRSARPDDAAFLAEAMLAASRGHLPRGWYDIALMAPENRCLEFLARLAVTEAASWWHHSHFLIATIDGECAAALAAFRAGDAYPLSGTALAEAAADLGLSADEQAVIWERGSYLFLCALGEDDCWAIENVYTVPRHRKRGLSAGLLERAVAEGRARGFGQAQITSFIGNDAAERVYRAAGFEPVEEKRHPGFEAVAGTPGMRRLVRPLGVS
jgi:translation initiation factor 4G